LIRNDLRNIAIIAHVDHGKTTLVDEMLRQGGAFRENQVVNERVMDNNDLERERGITILAKNTAIHYKDTKINVVDTPGHADFGGEVERILKMVNGVLVLVDAVEGTMPQTRFVLQKALEMNHKIIVVINKIDKPDARVEEVADEVLEMLIDLDATDEQLESKVIYCSGKRGYAKLNMEDESDNLQPLFDAILEEIPAPEGEIEAPLQLLVSSIDYNEYVGRIAVGRIERGRVKVGQEIAVCDYHDQNLNYRAKVTSLFEFAGLSKANIETASMGDIVCISGIESINIGNTICNVGETEAVPFVKISEPTVEMTFSVNDSPFAGQDGKYVTSRHLRDRLMRELLKDVSLRVSETDSTERFIVSGRGEMHLSILIENMRREGYEFQVSTPRVLFKHEDGVKMEPMERLVVDVPEESMGSVMEKMGMRKGEMLAMSPNGSRMRIEFKIPARGLFGYRSEFMTDTRGEGVLNTIFEGYEPYRGDIPKRQTGSLVAFESGEAVTYGLYNAQERGTLFITSGTKVYEGMIVGESPKTDDIAVNVCKKKHVTNMRAAGSDEALRLIPPKKMSLEEALEFLSDDELLEVTPKTIRLRKQILNNNMRMKALNRK